MTEERLGKAAGAMLRGIDRPPRDSQASVDMVMAQVRETRQARRWWPIGRPPVLPALGLPSRELAPALIPVSNGRTRPGGSTMFSALKFVVASVIVALFGGFLLAGVLTTQQRDEMAPAAVIESPSPVPAEESLSGMVTEEVEPGVYRVVNDGVRDLASVEAVDIVAGYDGGLWLLQKNDFLRLGSDRSHPWPGAFAPEARIFEVAPDGTMWVIPRWGNSPYLDPRQAPGLRSTDGEEWTVEPCPGGRQYPDCRGFSVAPDGRVWVSWDEDGRWRLGHLGPPGWQALEGELPVYFRRLFFTDTGDIYGMRDGADRLYRYEEGGSFRYEEGWNAPTPWTSWEYVAGSPFGPFVLGVGRDGTVWQYGGDGAPARFADGEWEPVTSTDLLDRGFSLGLDHEFKVGPDGSLWSSLWQKRTVEDRSGVCDGIARFDDQTLERFLPGRCIAMDIAADGTVWVLASDDMVWVYDEGEWILDTVPTWGLYVITPEAVAAST